MSTANLTSSFIEERYQAFLVDVDSFTTNQKTPAWFKPFFDLFKDFMKDVTSSINTLESQLGVQKKVTDALLIDRDSLKAKLEHQMQYTRRNMLLIHGVPEENGENTDDLVIDVSKKVGVDISKKNLNRTHRLGPKPAATSKKNRPIICSFISYEHKKAIYDAKKRLKGQRTVITESLTKSRYDLYRKCIEAFGKGNTWTYDGKIWCMDGDTKISVETDDDLTSY